MGASQLDIELSKYWSLLSPIQKKSLIGLIQSFLQSREIKTQELLEPETFYNTGDSQLPGEILQQLTFEQKEALIALIASFGIDTGNERISIEQYNKEIDEAMTRMNAGESYTHEEVIEMSKKWINGK